MNNKLIKKNVSLRAIEHDMISLLSKLKTMLWEI